MSAAVAALVCQARGQLPLASLSAASVARDEVVYQIDQRHGPIECGVFAALGQVTGFASGIVLRRADTRLMRFDLTLDLGSFVLREWQKRGSVPFGPWFTPTAYPLVRFRSSAVAANGSGRAALRGLLELGGVTRLQALDLTLSTRPTDPITGTDIVDLEVSGRFRQTALGIALSDTMMSNALDLHLAAALELES